MYFSAVQQAGNQAVIGVFFGQQPNQVPVRSNGVCEVKIAEANRVIPRVLITSTEPIRSAKIHCIVKRTTKNLSALCVGENMLGKGRERPLS